MEVVIRSLAEGAKQAVGRVAIIDVFRAFTTAAVALANGASRIIMVSTAEEALALRGKGVGQVCVGEVGGRAPAGFDFGNSPFEVSRVDFRGQTLIQRTSAGTQGIVLAEKAQLIYATSLVVASTTAKALRSGAPNCITLVAMGNNAISRTDEDELCALHLRSLLEGKSGNAEAVRALILASEEAERFGDPARPHFHPADLEIALDIDRYDFAIRVDTNEGRPVARIERPT
jgi:2-phosphosulfolactate phosphatase